MNGPVPKVSVLAIPGYHPGKASIAGASDIVKLSANENAFGASPAALAAYRDASADISLYPDMRATALRQAVAQRFSLEADQLIFGAGSDEIFALACHAFLNPGDNAVQPQYGFAAWIITVQAAGGEMRSAPERDFHVDVDAILDCVDARTRIAFIANPANPTGTAIPFSEIRRLHARLPENVLLIVDSAYADFARLAPLFEDGLALAKRAPNVLVTRTFSKLHGLAALRIGWGYGPRPVIDAMDRIRLPFNTTAPSHAAAIAALADEDFAERSIAYVEDGRRRLADFLRQRGVQAIPSFANFVTAIFPTEGSRAAATVDEALAGRGILVRSLGNYGLPHALRITIGADQAMQRLYAALDDILR
jgi:histidinol-phosphate aminotransferase